MKEEEHDQTYYWLLPFSFHSLVTSDLDYLGNRIYNSGHNVLRFFDVLPNFAYATSETKRDY